MLLGFGYEKQLFCFLTFFVSVTSKSPLTNLAVAVKLDPSLPSKLRSLTIMGGNMNGVGNTHLLGEFNFYGDPEGAKMVLDEYTPLVSEQSDI